MKKNITLMVLVLFLTPILALAKTTITQDIQNARIEFRLGGELKEMVLLGKHGEVQTRYLLYRNGRLSQASPMKGGGFKFSTLNENSGNCQIAGITDKVFILKSDGNILTTGNNGKIENFSDIAQVKEIASNEKNGQLFFLKKDGNVYNFSNNKLIRIYQDSDAMKIISDRISSNLYILTKSGKILNYRPSLHDAKELCQQKNDIKSFLAINDELFFHTGNGQVLKRSRNGRLSCIYKGKDTKQIEVDFFRENKKLFTTVYILTNGGSIFRHCNGKIMEIFRGGDIKGVDQRGILQSNENFVIEKVSCRNIKIQSSRGDLFLFTKDYMLRLFLCAWPSNDVD